MKWGYIWAKKLEGERSKSYAVSFPCEPRPSGVTLESVGLKDIPQVPGNRAELGQNHDARNAVSATISVLK